MGKYSPLLACDGEDITPAFLRCFQVPGTSQEERSPLGNQSGGILLNVLQGVRSVRAELLVGAVQAELRQRQGKAFISQG